MRRMFVFVMVCVAAFPAGVLGGARLLGLVDHFDSFQSVRVAQMYPEVAAQAQALDRFLETVLPRTLGDVEHSIPSIQWAACRCGISPTRRQSPPLWSI